MRGRYAFDRWLFVFGIYAWIAAMVLAASGHPGAILLILPYGILLGFLTPRLIHPPVGEQVCKNGCTRFHPGETAAIFISLTAGLWFGIEAVLGNWALFSISTLYNALALLAIVVHYKERKRHGSDWGATPYHQRAAALRAAGHARTLGGASGSAVSPFYASGASEGAGARLEVVEDDAPILAARWASLNPSYGGGLELRSLTRPMRLRRDMYATCQGTGNEGGHSAPGIGCTCGFYAVPGDKLENHTYMNSDIYPAIGLGVELSGIVIEHQYGYRAQHQHILEAYIPKCALWGPCADPATFLGLMGARPYGWMCDHHRKLHYAEGAVLTLEQVGIMLGSIPFVKGPWKK